MLTFIRKTPTTFWFALIGAAFFLCVFVSGIWGEMSPFAVVFLVPAYLLVAVMVALHSRFTWTTAGVVAAGIAVLEAGFALVFVTGQGTDKQALDIAAIHAAGAAIAAAAAGSAAAAVIHSSRLTSHGAAG